MRKTISLKLYLATICVFVLVIAFFVVYIIYQKTSKEHIEDTIETIAINHGDNFRDLPVINGETHNGDNFLKDSINLLIYLSDSCQACQLFIENVSLLHSAFGDSISFQMLWESSIPQRATEKTGLPLSSNFVCADSTRLATTTPTFYIVDQSGNVTFMTTDAEILIEKLVDMNLLTKSELQRRVFNYLTASHSTNDNDLTNLIYFAMDGCSDCYKADEMISNEKLDEKYNIIRIYKKNDNNSSRIKDTYNCLKTIFDIMWYPSFAIIENEEVRVIGEMSIDDLQAALTEA